MGIGKFLACVSSTNIIKRRFDNIGEQWINSRNKLKRCLGWPVETDVAAGKTANEGVPLEKMVITDCHVIGTPNHGIVFNPDCLGASGKVNAISGNRSIHSQGE